MSSFDGPLTITQTANWRRWRLETPLSYEIGFEGSGRVVTVPQGFVTDGASIPRFLWWLLPAWGSYSRAALIHDYLYVELHAGFPHPEAKSYAAADAIFRQAMKVSGRGVKDRALDPLPRGPDVWWDQKFVRDLFTA